MNKKKSIAVAVILAVVLLIGGLLAYFTDTETATNVFTLGNVDITLTEPNWSTTDANSNNIPDAAEARTPGQVIAKDPTVTVATGSNNAYLFLTVEVPAITTGANGTVTKELYTYTPNASWAEVTTKQQVKANSVVHVYVYGTTAAPTSTAAEAPVPALFSNVTVNTTLTNSEVTSDFSSNSNIVVNAYGIQADGLSVTSAADIYDLF